jgi:hypothetical protein
MAVVHEKNAPADLGQMAETGIHSPEPTDTHEEHDHQHGLEITDVLRVVFVAIAAAAVWFHLIRSGTATIGSMRLARNAGKLVAGIVTSKSRKHVNSPMERPQAARRF